ncbi:hypothetical protein FQN54_008986 [Arachnomyces sp. PD_36]|nr:hypothetical protein FQN54_008986 [Arachnomyces sp. PD_36]
MPPNAPNPGPSNHAPESTKNDTTSDAHSQRGESSKGSSEDETDIVDKLNELIQGRMGIKGPSQVQKPVIPDNELGHVPRQAAKGVTADNEKFPTAFEKFNKSLQSMAAHDEGSKFKDGINKGQFVAHRRLCHLAFSIKLEKLAEALSDLSFNDIDARWNESDDNGATFLFENTNTHPTASPPTDPVAIASYIASDALKIRDLGKIIADVCLERKSRLLLFFEWLMPIWITVIFLDSLGIRYKIIHEDMEIEDRLEAARAFEDSGSDVQILIMTYACVNMKLNLHRNCRTLVLMEPPRNHNIQLQAIAHLRELGQTQRPVVWKMDTKGTYDEIREF